MTCTSQGFFRAAAAVNCSAERLIILAREHPNSEEAGVLKWSSGEEIIALWAYSENSAGE
jgi:hypothetical protein